MDLERELELIMKIANGSIVVVSCGNEDRFGSNWMVAERGAKFTEGLPEPAELGECAGCIAIICKPSMIEGGKAGFEVGDKGQEVEPIEEHGEGAPLGDSGLAVEEG